MAQRRYTNFGDDVTSDSLNIARSKITSPMILDGGNFFIVNNTLTLSPISLILPSGIVLTEDQQSSINLNNVPDSLSHNFTIAYIHNESNIIHGSAALIEVYNDLLPESSITNGTILGWIRYPGGNVPLSEEHVIKNRSNKLTNNMNKFDLVNTSSLAPLTNKWMTYSQNGAFINITDVCDTSNPAKISVYTLCQNNNLLSGEIVKVIPFMTGQYPPGLININALASLGAEAIITVIDSTGEEISPSTNVLKNTGDFVSMDFTFDYNYYWLFSPLSIFLVKIKINLESSAFIKIKSIGYSSYNLPY